tara:strand:- start:1970 stop:2227 length:258 start_codon:yes stop_codon:yes gene_type:complete
LFLATIGGKRKRNDLIRLRGLFKLFLATIGDKRKGRTREKGGQEKKNDLIRLRGLFKLFLATIKKIRNDREKVSMNTIKVFMVTY